MQNTSLLMKFAQNPTAKIVCDPTTILPINADFTMIVDSLRVSNTTQYNTFIDIFLFRKTADKNKPASYYIFNQKLIEGFESRELLKDSCLYLQPGDWLSAYTDHVNHRIDCLISYRIVSYV